MLTAGYLNSLVEDGASKPHGTWAEGHHEPLEFAAVASKEYGHVIQSWQVRHVYVRKAFGQVVMTEVPGRGAWAATWAEW